MASSNTATTPMITLFTGEPNNDSPLNGHAAQLWENQAEYLKVLKAKYAEVSADLK
jgi:hypothetical protein